MINLFYMNLIYFKYILISLILFNTMVIHANEKFTLDGNVLYYNTEIASKEENREINWDDVDSFKKILSENPQIKSVYITSWGGQIDAAIEIGDIIIDYELNTHAVEICFSACPLAFLGGEKRTLQRGDKIGFHQGTWDAASIEEYYDDKETQEYYGWKNPFDFASWLCEDTQREIYSEFKYYIERGIDPAFVIETMAARSDDGWYPRRKELLDANFLTE